jgi:hypothetical protein
MNDILRHIEEQKEAHRKDVVVIRALLGVFWMGMLLGMIIGILLFKLIG